MLYSILTLLTHMCVLTPPPWPSPSHGSFSATEVSTPRVSRSSCVRGGGTARIVRDHQTHGTVRLSSRPPPRRAGHTRGRRRQWCRRSRRSPRWTRRSRCRRCKHPGMARGSPARKARGAMTQGCTRGLWPLARRECAVDQSKDSSSRTEGEM